MVEKVRELIILPLLRYAKASSTMLRCGYIKAPIKICCPLKNEEYYYQYVWGISKNAFLKMDFLGSELLLCQDAVDCWPKKL
jgi:hypothetical protein